MNANFNFLRLMLLSAFAMIVSITTAQPPNGGNVTESGNTPDNTPRDNFYDRYMYKEKQILAYDFIHEKDVFWEKRIWRVIDVREKMNHPFIYDKYP